MNQNLISAALTDIQRDAIIADVDGAITKLQSVKHPLTADQRRTLARLADTEIGLLDTALNFAKQNPGAIPGDLDIVEFEKDVTLAKQLAPVRARIMMLAELISDATMSVFSDAYVTALDIYRVAKALGRGAAFDAFIDDFGRRFIRTHRAPAPAGQVVSTPTP